MDPRLRGDDGNVESEVAACPQQRRHPQHHKNHRRTPVHQLQGRLTRDAIAEIHGRHIRQHHAQRGPGHHPQRRRIARRQRHRRDLRLVAHLGHEEGQHGGQEHAEAGCRGLVAVDSVGHHDPGRHRDEGDAEHPAHHVRPEQLADQRADRGGEGVVGDGGHENAEHDRQRAAKARGEQKGEQLGLVADFGEGDDAGGNEEGVHSDGPGKGRIIAEPAKSAILLAPIVRGNRTCNP